jgi:hypothetical protein
MKACHIWHLGTLTELEIVMGMENPRVRMQVYVGLGCRLDILNPMKTHTPMTTMRVQPKFGGVLNSTDGQPWLSNLNTQQSPTATTK